jgi:hypothetical protein
MFEMICCKAQLNGDINLNHIEGRGSPYPTSLLRSTSQERPSFSFAKPGRSIPLSWGVLEYKIAVLKIMERRTRRKSQEMNKRIARGKEQVSRNHEQEDSNRKYTNSSVISVIIVRPRLDCSPNITRS